MDAPAPGTLAAIWMVATAAIGALLLLCGGRLLLLMVTLAGGALGWVAGGALCESLVPEWSPALCAATCAVLCAGLAALFLRPAIALLMGVAGALAGLLVAGALIEGGVVPTGRAPYGSARSDAVEPSAAAGVRDARSKALMTVEAALAARRHRAASQGAGPAQGAAGASQGAGTAQGAEVPGTDSATLTLARVGVQLGKELASIWQSVPTQARTLLAAAAGAGGIGGLLLGILCGRWVMSGVAALVGAMLLCAGGLPLAERLSSGAVRAPESATGWLLLIGALTAGGWAFQHWRRTGTRAGAADTARA
jgi:hypothetical protein